MQIDAVGEERERLRRQLQLHASGFDVARPGERSLFQPFGHHPKARSIPIQNLDAGAPLVGEYEERSGARIFAQAFGDHAMKAVETFAQIDWLQCHADFEAAGETQHGAFSHARNKAAATPA